MHRRRKKVGHNFGGGKHTLCPPPPPPTHTHIIQPHFPSMCLCETMKTRSYIHICPNVKNIPFILFKVFLKVCFSILFLTLLYCHFVTFSVRNAIFWHGLGAGVRSVYSQRNVWLPLGPQYSETPPPPPPQYSKHS